MCSSVELAALVDVFKVFKQQFSTYKDAMLQNNFADIEMWCAKHEKALSFIEI